MLLSVCLDLCRPWHDLQRLAQAADGSGLSTVYVADHFMPVGPVDEAPAGEVMEGWTALTALAAATSRVRLGTLVLGNTYRHPAVVANMAATLDQVSGGRVTLGIGAAWQQNEHRAYGIQLPPVGDRLDRLEEAAHVVTSLLRHEVTTYEGRHYQLLDARCDPKPIQQPLPLLIAGGGERRTIPIAARYADAWHAWTEPDEFRRKSAVLDAACGKVGRDPSEVSRLTGQVLLVTPGGSAVDEDSDVIGPTDHVAARLSAYVDAAVDEFVVRDHVETPVAEAVASLEALASDVVPALS